MNKFYQIILTLFSGILFSLAWNNFIPSLSLFIAFVPLLFLMENKQLHYSTIFNYTFISFMIFHLGTVWWLYKSSIAGFITIITLNSLLMAMVMVLIFRVRQVLGLIAYWFSFTFIWLTFEYLHFSWELSWPFMNLGNWLGQVHRFVQWYEYTGVLGGSLWILIINLLIYLIIRNIIKINFPKALIIFIGTLIIAIAPIVISKNLYNIYIDKGETRIFKIIQPNIDPYTEKYNKKLFNLQVNSQIEIAKSPDTCKPDCYLFPESSFPVYYNENTDSTNQLFIKLSNELLEDQNAIIIGGLYSYRITEGDSLFFNTAFMLENNMKHKLRHKSKLVIGVEKMPFQEYFSFLKKWNIDLGGYTNSLSIDNNPKVFFSKDKKYCIAPVICYESIYGSYVSEFVNLGATSIAVITNDAWWGDTPGYYQHLMHSKLRAIENRRNVVRAANTGVTCIISQKGDILCQIKPYSKNTLTGEVNQNHILSFYANHGDYIGKIATIFSILILLLTLFTIILRKRTFWNI